MDINTLENKIKEMVDSHLNIKNVFDDIDFNNVILRKTKSDRITKETIRINNPEFRALKKVFNFIYADIENSDEIEEVWEKIYAFPLEKDCNTNTLSDPLSNKSTIDQINCTEDISLIFLTKLLQKAKDIHRTTFNIKAGSNSSKYFVIGDIGIGKTTFFKYLYSKYYDAINKKGVFWCHIDLNREYLRRLSIPEAIKFESARIFRKKILDKLDNDQIEKLESYIRSFYKKTDNNFDKTYEDYKTIFEEEQTTPYNKLFQIGLIRYIEKHYSPIYIIDGLDQLTNTIYFQSKIEDIKDIVSDHKRRGVFLFIMRKDTHLNFLNSYTDIQNSKALARLSSKFKRLEIVPAKLFDILIKRFELLIHAYEKIILENCSSIIDEGITDTESDIDKKTIDLIKKLKSYGIEDLSTLEAYLGVFLIFLNKGMKPESEIDFNNWELRNTITEFKDFIGTNFRVLMEAINIVHDVFVESLSFSGKNISDVVNIHNLLKTEGNNFFKRKQDHNISSYYKIMRRDYKVIPMLLEGYSNYSHPYGYEKDNLENKIGLIENRQHSRFIYSIFYPVNTENSEEKYTLLLKVRILQFLSFNHRAIMNEKTLINYFNTHFPYEEDNVKKALIELYKSLLIDVEIIPNGYKLKISRIGSHHINYLIKDFGYLRIILDDILVPDKSEKAFIDNNRHLYTSDRELWIINQVPRVALFLLLIKKVENWEEKNSIGLNYNEWSILEPIKLKVINSVARICYKPDQELTILKNSFTHGLKKAL